MTDLPYSLLPPDSKPSEKILKIPLFLDVADDPAGYLPDSGLMDAVNVALILRQPLLVTGEPGTGKSQLAGSVAYQIGLDDALVFETKSTSVARDLFYTFDNVGRFRAAQFSGDTSSPSDFITFNALGLAILRANTKEAVANVVPKDFDHGNQRLSVVLIDEIDKAPRDFPNDILNEIERFYFRIPELAGITIKADQNYRPIVIMTSNSEKSLPDAFLRRCIFYSIPFPDENRLEQILLTRIVGQLKAGMPILKDGVEFFLLLRSSENGLRKRPGTAELLNWFNAMLEFGCSPEKTVKSQERIARGTLSTLSKLAEDQEHIYELFGNWVKP